MADEIKDAVNEVMTAFEAFKETNDARLAEIEKKSVADPLITDKLGKIEETLVKHETKNQEITAAQLDARKAKDQMDEIKTQLEAIQIKMGRPGAGGALDIENRSIETKAKVNDWARAVFHASLSGEVHLSTEQKHLIDTVAGEYKTLGISNDVGGGYLAPVEYVAEIIKGVTEVSPARRLARLRTTAMKSVMIPKRTGQFAARWASDTGAKTETTGQTYGLVELTAPEMYAEVIISNQNMEDSAFDLQAEISSEAELQFAKLEGQSFVTGSGVGQMEGFLTNAQVAEYHSGSATTVQDAAGEADGILNLFYQVKTAYSATGTWALNRFTLGSVRKLKTTQGQYLWAPGIANGQANTINGAPYVEVPDMPSEAAGATPIAFGDFQRAYTMVDRIAMTMLRDPFSQAAQNCVVFWFRRRVGGQVVLAEAIAKLVCAA